MLFWYSLTDTKAEFKELKREKEKICTHWGYGYIYSIISLSWYCFLLIQLKVWSKIDLGVYVAIDTEMIEL